MNDRKEFSFEIITEFDGTIRLVNLRFDELPWAVVHSLMGGLLAGAKEYNEEIKEKQNNN